MMAGLVDFVAEVNVSGLMLAWSIFWLIIWTGLTVLYWGHRLRVPYVSGLGLVASMSGLLIALMGAVQGGW